MISIPRIWLISESCAYGKRQTRYRLQLQKLSNTSAACQHRYYAANCCEPRSPSRRTSLKLGAIDDTVFASLDSKQVDVGKMLSGLEKRLSTPENDPP